MNHHAYTQGFQQRWAQLEKQALASEDIAGLLGGAGGAGLGYLLSGNELDTPSVLRNMALGGIGGGVLGYGGMKFGKQVAEEGANFGRQFLDEQRASARGDMQALMDHADQLATAQRVAALQQANSLASGQRDAADTQLGERLNPITGKLEAILRALKGR